MQLRRLTLAALLLTAGWASAGEWGGPPVGALLAIRDMRLTMRALAALQEDKELKGLGVEVKNGTAHLWGPVADRAAERRAVSRLGLIVGIKDVKTDCHYARPQPRQPVDLFAARKVDLPPAAPGIPPATSRPPFTPVTPAVKKGPSAASVSRGPVMSLSARVTEARKADPRFRAVRVVVRGNNLTVLRGDDEVAASLFAQRLEAIPGVGDVVLGE